MPITNIYTHDRFVGRCRALLRTVLLGCVGLAGGSGWASFEPPPQAGLLPPKTLATPGTGQGGKAKHKARHRKARARRKASAPRPPADPVGAVSAVPRPGPAPARVDRPRGQRLRGHLIRPGADLRGADFTGARLGGMDFTGVSMKGVRLFGAHTWGAVGLDLTGAERHPFFDEDGEAPVGTLKFLVTGQEDAGPAEPPRNPVGGPGQILAWLEGTDPRIRVLSPTGASYLWSSDEDNQLYALARDGKDRLWTLGDRRVSVLELQRMLSTAAGEAFWSGYLGSDFTAIPNNVAAGPDGTIAVASPHRSRHYLNPRATPKERKVRSQDYLHPGIPAEARICLAPHPKGMVMVYAGPDDDTLYLMRPRAKVTAAEGYRLPPGSRPRSLVLGPDGEVWLTLSGRDELGAFNVATGEFRVIPLPDPCGTLREPYGLAPGPDGNLWFTERQGGRIGRVTPGGRITEFALPAGHHPLEIAPSTDGRMFFTLERSARMGSIRALPAAQKPPAPSPGDEAKGSGPLREPGGGGWEIELYQPRPEPARKLTDLERRERHAQRRERAEARAALRLEAEEPEAGPGQAETKSPRQLPVTKPDTAPSPLERLAEMGVNLPSRALAHILGRHGHGRMAGKSQFDSRFSSRDELAALIAEGLAGAGELARVRVVNDRGYYFTHCTRARVGAYHHYGQLIPTSRFAVLTARYGTWPDWEYDVITAYPVAEGQ